MMMSTDRLVLHLESHLDPQRIKRPGDGSDDEVHRPSVGSEPAPNQGIPLIEAPGNPLQAQDEYDSGDSSRSILAGPFPHAAH